MGFLAPAIPLLKMAIPHVAGAVAGGLLGKRSQQQAMQRTPEEQQALAGAQGVAGTLGGVGTSLIGQARPYLTQPANYYQSLLSGNRAAMTQAVAPSIAQTTDVYRGAERDLDRLGVRGAARDVAAGELNRQRASQLAGLVTGVQPGAAGALAGLGGTLLQQGGGLAGGAGNIYNALLNQGAWNRQYGREQGQQAGEKLGGLVADIGRIGLDKWGRGRGSMDLSFDNPNRTPSRIGAIVPGFGGTMPPPAAGWGED